MVEGMLGGLQNLTLGTLVFMLAGIVVAQIIVILPGLGGHFALVLLLPFVYTMEPVGAIAMLVGAAVTTGTGNTITSVLFGVPGSPTGVATLFDGYPMSQRGEGARAVAAGLTASAAGGLIGALVLGLILPFARPIVLTLSSPEYFVLILAAVVALAFISEGDTFKALSAGGLGFFASFVGRETSTGAERYTFDQLVLWDGIHLVPLFVGVFAIAEMLDLAKRGGTIARGGVTQYDPRGVLRGIVDVLRHWKATLISSMTGVVVGVVPGLGGAASQFIAYSNVARASPNREEFGKGAVEGVIAADAAVNATDAGQMVPTLAFGIPGSSLAAIMLAGLIVVGVRPGPEMLTTQQDILWMIVWILVLANVISALLCLAIGGLMARLTFLPSAYLIVPIFGLAFYGVYASTGRLFHIWLTLAAGVLGYLFKRYGYSRAAFVIAYVLGDLLEHHYLMSVRIYGYGFFFVRPITMAIIVVVAATFIVPMIRKKRRRERDKTEVG